MIRFRFIRARLLAAPPKPAFAIALGLAFVMAPTLLRIAADPVITGTAFGTYYPFVVLAAVWIGWRATVGVALASALLGNFLFMEPRYVLFAKVGDTVGTLIFLTSCSLIVLLVDTVRRAALEVQLGLQREARLVADLKHLNAELQHRVKNTLSVVQGLATQTFRHSPGDDETVRIFCGRLHALGQAHAVLTAGQWEMCQLPDLALRALAPFNGHSAISIEGPACKVPQQSCVPLVLALHELATNAVKYGALSTLDGIVDVRWAVQPGQGPEADQELVLDWTERGGPPVAPPSRRGLGSKLVARQHGIAAADLDFRPEGVACRLVSPGVILEPEEPN